MIEFNTPANISEALAILRAMREFTVKNPGGDDLRPAEVLAVIGNNFMLYTREYCALAQKRDGLFSGYDFSSGIPFWLEHLASGKLVPINSMAAGAQQLVDAITQQ